MFPYIKIFSITIPSYGFFILLGTIVAGIIVYFFPYRKSISKDDILHSYLFGIVGVIVGSKLLYIITILPSVIKNWDKINWSKLLLSELMGQGFVFYGGLIGAVIMIYIYTSAFKVNFWHILESIAVVAPLVHAFGRVGCTAAGCCYGIEFSSCFSLIYPEQSFAPSGVPLFPIQLLEAATNFIIFIVLFIYSRKQRKIGRVIGIYLLAYSVARFLFEYLRGDIIRGKLWIFTTSQWISIALFCLSLFFIFALEKVINKREKTPTG